MRRTLGLMLVCALALTGCGATSSARDHDAQLSAAVSGTVVVAVGDIACPPGSTVTSRKCRQAATAKVAAALHPSRVLALGDDQYQSGRYADFLGSYAKSWGKLRPITYPVVGNHEYLTAGAAGYYRYFKYRQPGPPGWYRRVINGWQVFVLNSNCSEVNCATERAWLEKQLSAHPSMCALIAMHHPRFSSGSEHGSSKAMQPFWTIAQRHHVDVALAGHDHDYERFAPKAPDGKLSANGIREFVSGTGGRSLYAKGTTVSGSKRFINTTFGVLQLTLGTSAYSWQFVDTAMRVRDSGSASCH